MAVILARKVDARPAGVGDDHADHAHFDDRLGDHLDGGEQAVEVIGAFHQHLQLAPAHTAGREEVVGHLEVVVVGLWRWPIVADDGGDDLTRGQRRAIVDGDDPTRSSESLITTGRKPLRSAITSAMRRITGFLPAERQVVDLFFGDDDELRQVDGIGAFAQDLALRAALAAVIQESRHILEIIGCTLDARVCIGLSGSPSRAKM